MLGRSSCEHCSRGRHGLGGTGAAEVFIPGLGNVTGQVANNSAEFNGTSPFRK